MAPAVYLIVKKMSNVEKSIEFSRIIEFNLNQVQSAILIILFNFGKEVFVNLQTERFLNGLCVTRRTGEITDYIHLFKSPIIGFVQTIQ